MNREKQEPTDKEELSDGGTKLKNVLANHGTVGSDCLDSGQFPIGKKPILRSFCALVRRSEG